MTQAPMTTMAPTPSSTMATTQALSSSAPDSKDEAPRLRVGYEFDA